MPKTKMVTISISVETAKQIHHRLVHKQRDCWVELREALRDQTQVCICCGQSLPKKK